MIGGTRIPASRIFVSSTISSSFAARRLRHILSRILFRFSTASPSCFAGVFSTPRIVRHFRTFVRLPMLGPGNARWLCLSSSFSHSLSLRSLARIPLSPPFVFLSPLTARQRRSLPLPISVSLAFPRLSRSRVLLTRTRFSSPLSSIRAPGYTADSHPLQGKGYPRGKAGEGGGNCER